MCPSLEISPQTFARLQTHAVPLIDDPESVINKMIDAYEGRVAATSPSTVSMPEPMPVRQFLSNTPPDLTHTKVLSIELDGKLLTHGQTNWKGLLIATIRQARGCASTAIEFKQLVAANFVEHDKNDEGYQFFPDLGISVQAQDANGSWRTACHIAQRLGCALDVTFVWRQKEGAAYPGTIGRLAGGEP